MPSGVIRQKLTSYYFLAAQGLQPRFAAQGLQPRLAAQGLQPRFAAQGLQAASWTLLDLLTSAAAAGIAVAAAARAATLRTVAVFLIIIGISRPKKFIGTRQKRNLAAECGNLNTIVSAAHKSRAIYIVMPNQETNHLGVHHLSTCCEFDVRESRID